MWGGLHDVNYEMPDIMNNITSHILLSQYSFKILTSKVEVRKHPHEPLGAAYWASNQYGKRNNYNSQEEDKSGYF